MTEIFSSFDNFRNLQASDFEWIESMAQAETHQPGTVLIKAGKFSPFIYLCLSGNLTATSTQANDSKQQLMEISAGELIGETSLLDDRPDLYSVTVTETAQLLTIPKHNIEHRLQSDRDFAASFYHLLSINLSKRLRKLTNFMGKQNIREGEPLRKVLVEMLSADIEVEDELDLDMLAGTAIAGTRFDWIINQLRR